MPSSNGRSMAFCTARMATCQASKPRYLRAYSRRTLSKISGLPRAASILSLRSRILRSGICVSMTLRAKASAPSRSFPSSASVIDDAPFERLLGAERRAGKDRFERSLDAAQARQALRAAGAGNETKFDLGKAEFRRWHRHAVVTHQRHFETAAERGAVHGGNDRLWTAFKRSLQFRQRRAFRLACRIRKCPRRR